MSGARGSRAAARKVGEGCGGSVQRGVEAPASEAGACQRGRASGREAAAATAMARGPAGGVCEAEAREQTAAGR
jgi:hypothetical protein